MGIPVAEPGRSMWLNKSSPMVPSFSLVDREGWQQWRRFTSLNAHPPNPVMLEGRRVPWACQIEGMSRYLRLCLNNLIEVLSATGNFWVTIGYQGRARAPVNCVYKPWDMGPWKTSQIPKKITALPWALRVLLEKSVDAK